MFTGIVEEMGTVFAIKANRSSAQIQVKAKKVLEGTRIGDSIAVNGVCLTVTVASENFFTADVMPETWRRSNLGALKSGNKVNLERAMAANGRFGGHIVSGHIDGVGTIVAKEREENAVWITIKATSEILRRIIEKGSIAIDGVSLTIADLQEEAFRVSLIPHTGEETTLLEKSIGAAVNLENDLVGKYVERLLHFGIQERETGIGADKKGLTLEYLKEYGF